MPIIDPDQGVPLPTGTDLANNPAAFSNFYTPVLSRQNNRYTDVANRTALHPANIEGEESYLTTPNQKEMNTGVAWISAYVPSLFAYVRKTASQTINNSTALTNDTELFVALPTAGTFGFDGVLFYDSSTVADIQFALTIPAGAAITYGFNILAAGAAGTTGDVQVDGSATGATAVPGGGAGAGNIIMGTFHGEIAMGGTAGNLQLQWAQNTLEVSNTVVRVRSRMKAWRSS